ncbi:hypothetical protein F6455_07300 [Proteobacteria bacterium 005FR1]|nr:hypothetical protein [Proteobacteria bacterium 005FR1]
MKRNVRFAGVSEPIKKRLRLATNLLEAYDLRVAMQEWDGTRCDLLLVQDGDSYGQHAMLSAQRRHIPVLVFTSDLRPDDAGLSWLPESFQLPQLVRTLARLLGSEPSPGRIESTGLLCVAGDQHLRGQNFEARLGPHVIRVGAESGRVTANTLSDLLAARERIASGGWSFTTDRAPGLAGEVSSSLDVFFIRGALQLADELPRFPAGLYRLRGWPDLGSAPDLVNVLQLAGGLLRRASRAEELASRSRMGIAEVHACLWAFRAANLLIAVDERGSHLPHEAPPAPDAHKNGLLARLAARFGLQSS